MNNERDFWTIQAMRNLGGGFVVALGGAAMCADDINIEKIKVAFPEYWAHYEKLGFSLEKKQKVPVFYSGDNHV